MAIADAYFLVTAAHVALAAQKMEGSPGIVALKAGSHTPLSGEWTLSASDSGTLQGDKYDIAVYRLNDNEHQRLAGCDFVRISDVDFTSDLSNGYFVLCGFPSVWSESSDSPSATMVLKPLLYGAWTYAGSSSGLQGFDTNHHMLLHASPDIMLDHEGRNASMRTRSNHWVGMPGGLRGISGCSVWMIGDITLPANTWSRQRARIVGVETGVYEGAVPTIKASKWRAVLSLIYAAFSDLQHPINFHIESQLN
ncbi:hypothetical protein ACHAC9_16875 [Massilia sp. CMS3.1]|uniref:hypothetical protein n=1 Tax=Massilia sp. CMS3.1 TaxID=3373083 RepID=UPI003EE5DC0D